MWGPLPLVNKVSLQRKFGAVVRSKRDAANMTQEDLAHKAGIHRTYLSLLERGKRTPTIEVVRLLAKAFKTTMTAIVAELEGITLQAEGDKQGTTPTGTPGPTPLPSPHAPPAS